MRWSLSDVAKLAQENPRVRAALRDTQHERVRRSEQATTVEAQKNSARFDCVNISIHTTRKRKTDTDGARIKPVIDGLVQGRIIVDDTEDQVKRIRVTQELGDTEQTLVTVVEASPDDISEVIYEVIGEDDGTTEQVS